MSGFFICVYSSQTYLSVAYFSGLQQQPIFLQKENCCYNFFKFVIPYLLTFYPGFNETIYQIGIDYILQFCLHIIFIIFHY